MNDFNSVKLKNLILHIVGNKVQEESLILEEEIEIGKYELLYKEMLHYFLRPINSGARYQFCDESGDLKLNEMYGFAKRIFENPAEFKVQSENMAKHLFSSSTHPRIQGGEFYVAYLEDCIVDGDVVDGIGIFKSEKKNVFITVNPELEGMKLDYKKGSNKIDKACIILNDRKESGFKILLKEESKKSVESGYWSESFLRVEQIADSHLHTTNYLQLCRGFVADVFNEDHNVEKPEQIAFLQRSLNYFGTRDEFNVVEFENEVLEEPDVIDSFIEFRKDISEKYDIEVYPEFQISADAVRKARKDFKCLIKLDGGKVQIAVKGNEEYIEKGFDNERNMNYYTVYFHEED
ncbi:nucleoid-associated protein [Limibacter armeniacum]|uniref:nucleoid-associated protein n=1 Tax=Limibacter armeniacum TaxID=466084 RepID=UPI002FE5B821